MLHIFGCLLLAQASFALIIINNWPSVRNHHSSALQSVEINPNFNDAKCLDVQGAVFANGTAVQIYDCNGTPAQQWVFHRGSTAVQVAGQNYCLDAGSTPGNGTHLKIWECFSNLPAQEWFYTDDNRIALENQGFCADLTNGVLTNGNPVQIWKCTDNDVNQIWTTTPPGLNPLSPFKHFSPFKPLSPFTLQAPEVQVILD